MVSVSVSLPSLSPTELLLLLPLILIPAYIVGRAYFTLPPNSGPYTTNESDKAKDSKNENGKKETKSVMSAPNPDLAPPRDDPFTLEELKKFDGNDTEGKIYVAIKGTVFDVTAKRDMYGPGKSYNVFAGKDGSRGLGMSSLRPEDAVPDYSTLDASDRKVLDDWHDFFSKRYNVVGRVADLPTSGGSASSEPTSDAPPASNL